MELTQAIQILKLHNEWRRGAEIDMLSPKMIGEAIDKVIELEPTLKKYIQHIQFNEGIDYLSDSKIEQSVSKFTDNEIELLRSLR
jgi:hypothetical protein